MEFIEALKNSVNRGDYGFFYQLLRGEVEMNEESTSVDHLALQMNIEETEEMLDTKLNNVFLELSSIIAILDYHYYSKPHAYQLKWWLERVLSKLDTLIS